MYNIVSDKKYENICHLFLISAASTTTIECYTCTSNADSYCMDNPSTLTRCPISHGKGCATKISLSGVMERGCSDIGIAPQGCQVNSFFGTECVCHSDRWVIEIYGCLHTSSPPPVITHILCWSNILKTMSLFTFTSWQAFFCTVNQSDKWSHIGMLLLGLHTPWCQRFEYLAPNHQENQSHGTCH